MASLNRWLEHRRNPWKGVFFDAFRQWRRDDGVQRLNDLSFLRDGDTVLDFGGFRGEWTAAALRQAKVSAHIFEPHPGFASALKTRFARQENVHVHDCALGRANGTMTLSDAGDASSSVAEADRGFDVQVIDARDFFDAHDLHDVALAKINIEGGEYDLLPALTGSGTIAAIARLHVQFHLFAPEFEARREAVRAGLRDTHDCLWEYPFVWEAWQRRA